MLPSLNVYKKVMKLGLVSKLAVVNRYFFQFSIVISCTQFSKNTNQQEFFENFLVIFKGFDQKVMVFSACTPLKLSVYLGESQLGNFLGLVYGGRG